MHPARLLALLVLLPLLLLGGGQAEDTSEVELSSGSTCKRPTFEPMTLDQYKEAYPELLGLSCGIEKFFDTYINVCGVTVAAMPNTPVPEIIHAAKIFAQLIDNDEDFIPDDQKIFDFHQKDSNGRDFLIVLVDTKALDIEWIAFKPGQHKHNVRDTPASVIRGMVRWILLSRNCFISTVNPCRKSTQSISACQMKKLVPHGLQLYPIQWIWRGVSTRQ